MGRGIDIDALFVVHREPLLRYFARRTADAEVALDLWAETFAQAVKSQGRYRGTTSRDEQAGWLYGIARRQLAMYVRKGYAEQRAVVRLGIERPPASDALLRAVEQHAALADVRVQISDALATLSDDTRRAVEMRVVHERSYEDVARALEITETAARARVSRGLQALSRILDPQLLDEVTAA